MNRPRPSRSRLLRVAVLVLTTACLAATGAQAQDRWDPTPFRVQDHAVVWQRVDEFRRFAAEGSWPLAVKELQDLLDLRGELGLMMRLRDERPARYVSAGQFARTLFEALPPQGRAAWEAVSREKAEGLLSRGLRLRRVDDLRAVARRFPARDLRRRAHDALARLALAEGDLRSAGVELGALLKVCDEEARPEVFARLALVHAQDGDRAGVDRVARLSTDLSTAPVPGPEGPEELGAFLVRMQNAAGPPAQALTGWPQFGGNPDGVRPASTPPKPGSRQWRRPLATKFVRGRENPAQSSFRYSSNFRPVFPALAQGVTYLNNGRSVSAADVATGKRRWTYRTRLRASVWRDNRRVAHAVALEGSHVYAPLATRSVAPRMEREFYQRTIVYALPHRAMHALDRASGKVVWAHDEQSIVGRPDEAEIFRESVAAPPLVVGNDLIVATWVFEGDYEVRLVCFDRRTGRTRWRRSLVHGQQELNLFGRPVKELVTSALAELDGVIYVATGLGIAAAVDRARGEILWMSAYPQARLPAALHWHETPDRPLHWQPSPTCATRRAVLFAPPDSDRLLAMDPLTGAPLWEQRCLEGSASYHWFLGVVRGNAYVLASNRLKALDVRNGGAVWQGPGAGRLQIPSKRKDHRAVGRAVLTEDRAYIPTAGGTILVTSLASGQGEENWDVPKPDYSLGPGNLLSADGTLLWVTERHVDAFYEFEELKTSLLERLARHPDDPRLRLEAGEIFRNAGLLEDAVTSLGHGIELAERLSPGARARLETPLRHSLHKALRERSRQRVARADVRGALADLDAAVEAADDPADAASALFSLADLARIAGKQDTSATALDRITREFPNAEVLLDDTLAHAGAVALFRLGSLDARAGRPVEAAERWLDLLERHADETMGPTSVLAAVHESLADLARRAGDEVTQIVTGRARAALEKAKLGGGPAALARVARIYPSEDVRAQAALMAADAHAKAKQPFEVVQVLTALLRNTQEDRTRARALWRLAEAYRKLGALAKERATLRRMVKEVAAVKLTRETAGELATRILGEPRFAVRGKDLPNPRPPLELLWEIGPREPVKPMIQPLVGPEPKALRGRILVTRRSTLELLDVTTAKRVWQAAIPLEPRLAAAAEGLVVLVGDRAAGGGKSVTVQAYDAATGDTRWTRTILGSYQSADANLGAVYVLTAEPTEQTAPLFTVTSVDLRTGGLVASRTFHTPLRQSVTAADDAVLVYEYSRGDDDRPPRTVVTLDASSLALRGRVALAAAATAAVVYPAGTGIAVAQDSSVPSANRTDTLVGIDLGSGSETWRIRIPDAPERKIKKLHGFDSGLGYSDTGDHLTRIDPKDGSVVWRKDFSKDGVVMYEGEAFADGVAAVTVRPKKGAAAGRTVQVICLSLGDGSELWRTSVGDVGKATPTVTGSVIAVHLATWGRRSIRSSVLFLDRADGRLVQTLEHEILSGQYLTPFFLGDHVVLDAPPAMAVYGPRRR